MARVNRTGKGGKGKAVMKRLGEALLICAASAAIALAIVLLRLYLG